MPAIEKRRLLPPRPGQWVRVWLSPMGREVVGQVARLDGELVVEVVGGGSVRLMLPHDAWDTL
jgi:hypothetical protein